MFNKLRRDSVRSAWRVTQKLPKGMASGSEISLLLLFAQRLTAALTDLLAGEGSQAFLRTAENAGILLLLQKDRLAAERNFQAVALFDVQRASQLHRKHNTSKLVNFSYDSRRSHVHLSSCMDLLAG